MRLVMTLVVRDEAEIIADQLDYHLAAGVDYVIATDHRSRDGTTEILGEYERRGVLRLLREEGEFVQQGEWQTRMARLAATEHGADWVITSDADEFWWPRGGSIREFLGAVPPEIGAVRGLTLNFVPLRNDSGVFAERMTIRLSSPAPINDTATPYRPVAKVAHRGDPAAVISRGGAHGISGIRGALLTPWHAFDVLHFPLRSEQQCERKYRKTWTGWESNLRADLARARDASLHGRASLMWNRVALDGSEVARGLAAGSLVVDTRVRDALGALRGAREPVAELSRNPASRTNVDAAVFMEAELVRGMRWLDDLRSRVDRIERGARA